MSSLSRIAPELPARNLPETLDYYEQKLGFRVAMTMPDGSYAVVERDVIAIHLFEAVAAEHSPVGIHIFTSGLEGLLAELEQRGAQVTQQIACKPWGNRDFRAKDPFGNELKFTEPIED